ncbi:MFS transporter [Paraburkholderia sp. D1E]|uniref:MFS transporter n=1 Tax=Paraburkholderia sp. D1E TaxID=3461398 RepID=UPI0040455312
MIKGVPPEDVGRNSMKKVAAASMTGTVIEFYEFLIYGTAAALVFAKVFFPELGQATGTALAIATQGVAFVARPLGSMIFGHFGDKLGRKKTLVATLLLMGCSTVAIGLLPTASSVGIWAPITLVALRVAQGLAIGGEWAGAALLAAENSPPSSRGMYAIFPQLGPSIAFALASSTYLIIALTMSAESFISWGWRIPFLLSTILIVIGFVVRSSIEESLDFRRTVERKQTLRVPIVEVLRKQGKEAILGGLAILPTFAFFYVGASNLTSYATRVLGLSKTTILAIGVVSGCSWAITTVVGSLWSDRVGRKTVILFGGAVSFVAALLLFPIINQATPLFFLLGMVLLLGSIGFAYGPMGAMLPMLFVTKYRYSAAGFSYSVGGVLGGGVVPLVAPQIERIYGSYSIGLLLAATALLSCIAVLGLQEENEGESSILLRSDSF